MSTSNLLNARFDDSEDEDDFNPQPADLSDIEEAGGSDHDEDAGAQIQNEVSRKLEVNDDDGSNGEPTISKRRSSTDGRGSDIDEDEELGEGEDILLDEDEEEDEEEEEITVRILSALSTDLQRFQWWVTISFVPCLTRFTGSSQKASTRASKPVPRCRS
jgi:hypothetical protein